MRSNSKKPESNLALLWDYISIFLKSIGFRQSFRVKCSQLARLQETAPRNFLLGLDDSSCSLKVLLELEILYFEMVRSPYNPPNSPTLLFKTLLLPAEPIRPFLPPNTLYIHQPILQLQVSPTTISAPQPHQKATPSPTLQPFLSPMGCH